MVQDLLVCMGMSAHICEGTHTCMHIWMETDMCEGTETCVYIWMGAHVYEGIHASLGWRCTHEGTDACVYIWMCAHMCEAHMLVYNGEYACGDSSNFIFFHAGSLPGLEHKG